MRSRDDDPEHLDLDEDEHAELQAQFELATDGYWETPDECLSLVDTSYIVVTAETSDTLRVLLKDIAQTAIRLPSEASTGLLLRMSVADANLRKLHAKSLEYLATDAHYVIQEEPGEGG